MKTYTEEEFKTILAQIKNAVEAEKERNDIQPLFKQVKKFIPDAYLRYRIDDAVTTHLTVFDISVAFVREGILFTVLKSYKTDKYYFDPNTDMFTVLDRQNISQIKERFTKPCNIGTFTTKKTEDWISYGIKVYRAVEIANREAEQKRADFLQKLKGEKIQWKRDGKSGEVKRNGLVFKFEFSGNYISQRIELSYIPNNYDIFSKMAENQYNEKL